MAKETVLITGAAGGIGREFANVFSQNGYSIVAVDLAQDALDELGKELQSAKPGVSYEAIPMDLSSNDAAEKLVAVCDEKGLTVDVLVNNVGFGLMGEHVEICPERIEKMILVNNLLLTKLSHIFGARMKERRKGSILNVASMVGFSPAPFFTAYSATKAYTLSFSQGLARELGEYGVQVSCLCPGTTKTAFLDTAQTESDSASGISKFVAAYMVTPDVVALAGFQGLKNGKITILPNRFLAFQAFFLRYLPVSLVSWFVHKRAK